MGAIVSSLARRARSLLALVALCAAAGLSPAFAATLTVLADTDNDATTGCTVATPNGPFDGVERRFITTVDTTQNPPVVAGITQENCVAGVFEAPTPVGGGGWPVGVGNGLGGYNVIETGLPLGGVAVRVAIVYTDPGIGADAVTVGLGGGPIIILTATGDPTQVPVLSDAMLVLLTLLMMAVGWKYGRRHFPAAPLAVVALALVTTLAWAAIMLDGQAGDWVGPPVATDPADSPPGVDISAVYGVIEGGTLYVRVDTRTALPPVAAADVYTATSGVPLDIAAGAGLLANDTGGVPQANVASFGGGSLGGAVTTNAVPGTALFGVGGSLAVNADGSFTYVAATGFTGAFTFNYRIANASGTSDGTVTINTQQAPAITSAATTTFLAGSFGTFTVTATGFPTPTLSMPTGTLPAGVTFDPGTGILSGTPTAPGSFPVTFRASNGVSPDADQAFTLVVNQAVTITSAAAATFTVGSPDNFTITTTATPVVTNIAITGGTLPGGVTLGATSGAGTAILSGPPAALTGGIHALTITASNGGVTPNGTQAFTLTVNEAPTITSAATATFAVGVNGSFTATATGFPAPTFSTTDPLPGGVTLTPAGLLQGTPAAGTAGSYPITLRASNGVGLDATQPFTLTVTDAPSAVADSFTVVHDSPFHAAPPGLLGNDHLGVPAGAITSFGGGSLGGTVTSNPAGVSALFGTGGSLQVAPTGEIAFTPSMDFAGDFTFSYRLTNPHGSSDATVTFTVTNERPVVDLNGPAAGIDFAASFNEGAGPVAIVDAATLTVADTDDPILTGATIQITNLLDGADEILAVTCPGVAPVCVGAIDVADVVYTPASGTLEILGDAPLADFQALLRTLTYQNLSSNPTGTPRDVTVTLNDGIHDNDPVAHAIVAIAGVNQAPVIAAPATTVATPLPTPVGAPLAFAGTVSVSDPDAGTADVQVTLTATNGTASLSGTAGLSSVTGNGTATVTATGPITSLNAALNGMTFNPAAAYSGPATLVIDASDLGNTGTGGTLTDTHTVHIVVDDRPAVTATIPAASATAVSAATTITLTFNENVTVTGASFTINCAPSGARTFLASGSGTDTVVLTPTSALPAGETCTVTTLAAQVTDSIGQSMLADHVFSFSVNSLPTVTSTTPANGATGLQLDTNVIVGFSEAVNATAASFTVSCATSGAHTFAVSGSGTASITLDPTTDFAAGELCTVTALAAGITDVDGSQNMAADDVFSFTIGIPPAITSGNAATFFVGQAGLHTVTTTGSPTASSILMSSVTPGPGGALPAGVAFNYGGGASATLSGTAGTAAHVGTYVLSFTASNGIVPDFVQNPFTLTVQCPTINLAPAAGSAFTATYNQAFSQAFAPSGGTAPYTYVLGGTALPSVAMSGDNLAGTPNNTGSFAFTLQAVDNLGCTSPVQAYTLNVDPFAGNDAYTALGNVRVDSSTGPGTPFSVIANDSFPGVAMISGFSGTSANGGTVSMVPSGPNIGTFQYNPPVGFTGSDTFTYTLLSNGRTAVGTVTFTVTGKVWFVNNAVGACPAAPCDGRMTHPFPDFGALQGVNGSGAPRDPADGDPIFVHSGTYPAHPITLRAGQRLIGEGASTALATLAAVTPQNGQVLPATGGAAPTVGGAVTLGAGNFIHGLTLGGSTALTGNTFGTLTLNDNVSILTAGAALDLALGTANATFTGVQSSGGTSNVRLDNVLGTLDLGVGSLAGATSHAFDVNAGTANITYGGSITNGSPGFAVRIANKSGGTATFNGAITDTGVGGIQLTSNAGATIAFNGGMSITTTGSAFNATGGGTVTVTGTNNILDNSLGTALEVRDTTIGPAGLTFRTINSTLGTANGITLVNTGNQGGLTVTGTGGSGSGGVITNKSGTDLTETGMGVYLSSTRNVVLRRMMIAGTNLNYGIRGYNVDGFTLEDSTVSGTHGSAASLTSPEVGGEGAIYFGNVDTNGILGSGRFVNNQISGGRSRNLSIINTGGVLGLTIQGNTFGLNQNFIDAQDSLLVDARGGTVNVTLGGANPGQGNIFEGAPGPNVNFTGQAGTTMTVDMRGNALTNVHALNIVGGGGLMLATQGSMMFTVDGNAINGADGSAITLFKAAAGSLLSGTVSQNFIGTSGVPGSGSKSGNGIFVSAAGAGTMTLAIQNNTIRQYRGNAAIYADNTGGSYAANFTILNNLAAEPGPAVFAGLAITNGAPASTDTIGVCADIRNNDFSQSEPTSSNDIIVGASGAAGGHAFNLPGYVGSTLANVEAFIRNNNTLPGSTAVVAYTDAPVTPAAFTSLSPACAMP